MINLNNVVLVGRLTKDIDLRKTNDNVSVCQFTLAVNRPKKKDSPEDADFINCVAWNQSADFLSSYARKGTIVSVEGKIQTRNYEGKNGKVFVTEVVANSVQIISNEQKSNSIYTADVKGTIDNEITNEDFPWE